MAIAGVASYVKLALPNVGDAPNLHVEMLAGMDTSDLRSVYAYLKTVKPVSNKVEQFVKAVAKK